MQDLQYMGNAIFIKEKRECVNHSDWDWILELPVNAKLVKLCRSSELFEYVLPRIPEMIEIYDLLG